MAEPENIPAINPEINPISNLVIDLTLTMETPLSIGAGGSSGSLASKAIVRNARGQLLLPGSHLKGRIRHGCEVIARAAGLSICESPRAESMCPNQRPAIPAPCPICQLFGSPAYPGSLFFSDLIYDEPLLSPAIRPSNSVNRRRRVVEENRLFFIETSPPGEPIHFHNSSAITGTLAPAQASAQSKLLLAGLQFVQTWGGGKSRGLGWSTVACQAALNGQKISLTGLEEAIGTLR